MSEQRNRKAVRVEEWETGLPNGADLPPLSQQMVPLSLASAFSLSHFPCDQDSSSSKRQRVVWTPQLHKRFVEVVDLLGAKSAVPKTIMQMMNVEGLTRENVASHLQKYRLYLKRLGDNR